MIMAVPSQLFYRKTKKQSVYNIQAISNIPSVIRNGILSYNLVNKMIHVSIAMSEVQNKRDNRCVPNGGLLHSYANAYFDPRNPMMYKRQEMAQSLCVLAISSVILDFEGTVVSDGNAASDYSRFYAPEEGMERLEFARIYDKSWTDKDFNKQKIKKRIKCAEILVPNKIAYDYVMGAIVVDEHAKQELQSSGFQKEIVIAPKVFFRRED